MNFYILKEIDNIVVSRNINIVMIRNPQIDIVNTRLRLMPLIVKVGALVKALEVYS